MFSRRVSGDLPPVAPNKSRSWEVKKVDGRTARYASLTSIFAALYAVCVVALAPISFQVFQVRVADALLPLAILFGWPSILGFSAGAFIANFFGGLGVVDIVGGSVANFLATYVAWKIGQKHVRGSWIVAIASEIILVAAIVGSYLSYLFEMPIEIGLSGVLLGSCVSIGILGAMLLLVMSRSVITDQLKSRGLIIYRKETKH
jgi:uncharacterized membrane protein